MPAPTPAEILAADHSLSISCDTCRILAVPVGLVERLAASGRRDTPVDQFRFRCTRCGALGDPFVHAAGNMTMGRPRLWPPAE